MQLFNWRPYCLPTRITKTLFYHKDGQQQRVSFTGAWCWDLTLPNGAGGKYEFLERENGRVDLAEAAVWRRAPIPAANLAHAPAKLTLIP